MKKVGLYLLASLFSTVAMADYVMYVNQGETKVREEKCSDIDSIKTSGTEFSVFKTTKKYPYGIDTYNITFEEVKTASDTVKIAYNSGIAPVIVNPYPETVMISTSGEHVSVNCVNQLKDVVYLLSGTSANGSFTIDAPRKFTLVLDNLSLTSMNENSAIRSLSGSTMAIVTKGESALCDSKADTCSATLRSKGQIVFTEECKGSLIVSANAKRAIQTGDYLQIDGGDITASSLVGDAVKANDYFEMNGGSLVVMGTGIEVSAGYAVVNDGELSIISTTEDAKGLKVAKNLELASGEKNGTLVVNGGEIKIDVDGNGSKGIKTDCDIIIKGGKIRGVVKGGAFYDDVEADFSYASLIKADRRLEISGGEITVELLGAGSRALASDSGIVVNGNAEVNVNADYCEAHKYITEKGKEKVKSGYGFKSDGSITFAGSCKVDVSSSTSSNSVICAYAESANSKDVIDVIFEENSLVHFYSYSNYAIRSSYIRLNGGALVAVSGTKVSDAKTAANGGTYIGLASANSILMGGSLAFASDSKYDLSPIAIADATGNLMVYKLDDSKVPFTTGYLQIALPSFASGAAFTYTYGGTFSATGAQGGYGYYTGATYTGGTTAAFSVGAKNSNTTIK